MNYSRAIFLISDEVRALNVTYEPDVPPVNNNRDGIKADRVLYKTLDPSIKKGDYVVVPTDTRHKMTVCQVDDEVDVDDVDLESSEEIKWIIGVVNRANFEDIKAQEGDAIAKIKKAEKRAKRAELRKKLLIDAKAEDEIKALPIYTSKENGQEEVPQPFPVDEENENPF